MKYYKAVVFCSNRVEGVFRFKDVFQIYPLSIEEAPKSELIKIYPFVLEYCITDEGQIELDGELKEISNFISELTQSANFQNLILNFLTAFSNYRFFFPKPNVQWFVSIDHELSEAEMNNQISKPGLNVYRFPTMSKNAPITAFTEVDQPEIEPKEHPEYFQNLDIEGTEVVCFSKFMSAAFHNYFLLAKEQQEAIESAAILINQGIELQDTMKSLSFISFVSSIETMVELENKGVKIERCETCKIEKYRVTVKFINYVYKYATNNKNAKKQIQSIYNLRSKIAHTGMLLFGDGKINWSDNEEKDGQRQTHLQAMQLSRLSLMNWVLMRGSELDKQK